MRPILLLVLFPLLTACYGKGTVRQPPPAPEVIRVPVPTYVPIDAELTARCQWRKSAPLEVMPSVARERKKCLQFYEANLGAIERVQGKPVPPPETKK